MAKMYFTNEQWSKAWLAWCAAAAAGGAYHPTECIVERPDATAASVCVALSGAYQRAVQRHIDEGSMSFDPAPATFEMAGCEWTLSWMTCRNTIVVLCPAHGGGWELTIRVENDRAEMVPAPADYYRVKAARAAAFPA